MVLHSVTLEIVAFGDSSNRYTVIKTKTSHLQPSRQTHHTPHIHRTAQQQTSSAMPAEHTTTTTTTLPDPGPDGDGSGNRTLNIAIIGAGITGINVALGLEHQIRTTLSSYPSPSSPHLAYTIYERAPGFREIGAGIGFSPNAEKAMGVLNPDVLRSFRRVANPNGEDYFQWIDGTSDTLLFKLYCGKDGFQGCRRSDILEEWAKLVPEEKVQFGKAVDKVVEPCTNAATGEGGDIEIKFTDGTTARADVVIGCDGIRSRIRELILPSQFSASYSRKFCFRALIPMSDAVSSLGEKRAYTRYMYNGPGAHIITYPVGNNSVLNVLAVISDPEKEWKDKEGKHTALGLKREAIEAFNEKEGWCETARRIVELFPKEEMEKWAIFDTAEAPAPTYLSRGGGKEGDGRSGRVCVAGDAAHAAGPHLGAGGGMGIEDALVLSALLGNVASRHSASSSSSSSSPPHQNGNVGRGGQEEGSEKERMLEKALQVYNDIRYERTQWVVRATRQACDLFQWEDEKTARDGEKFGREITSLFHRVWEYDVEGMVKEALAGLEGEVVANVN